MQLIDTWEGRGRVSLLQGDTVAIRYEIDLWRVADNAIVGRGHLEADENAIRTLRSVRGPISLSLSDGTTLNAVVVDRGGGRTWAAVYLPRPIPELIPAAWPDAGMIPLRSVSHSLVRAS